MLIFIYQSANVLYPSLQAEVLSIHFDTAAIQKDVLNTTLYMCQITNATSVQNSFQISHDDIKKSTSSAEFSWNSKTAVSVGTTFSWEIPFFENEEVKMGASETFTVGEKEKTKISKEESWKYTAPVQIPPQSTVTMTLAVQQAKITLPFTATIKRGNDEYQEKGTFKGQNGFLFISEITEEPLN